jgi:NADH:ubiquinone oxidoreductase subunit
MDEVKKQMIAAVLRTFFKGRLVGVDAYGNRYYTEKGSKNPKVKRWVMYRGLEEASKVTSTWHRWLHDTTDVIPQTPVRKQYPWQKDYLPNLTGTEKAYMPPNHTLKGSRPNPHHYEPWSPQELSGKNNAT